jgi:hypothetical protein
MPLLQICSAFDPIVVHTKNVLIVRDSPCLNFFNLPYPDSMVRCGGRYQLFVIGWAKFQTQHPPTTPNTYTVLFLSSTQLFTNQKQIGHKDYLNDNKRQLGITLSTDVTP